MGGRRDGFDEFVGSRSHRLVRLAYLFTHDWAAAEDLLQDSLTKTWSAWPRIAGDPEPYVRRIIATTFVSQHRRRRERPADMADEPVMSADAIGTADERDALLRALARLPARQRAVIVLRYYEDLSERDIAAVLHCSAGTVKSQASKALAKLRVDATLATGSTQQDVADVELPEPGRASASVTEVKRWF